MPALSRIVQTAYIVLLATALGVTAALGAMVAPTIFRSELYLGAELLTHFQEGLLMTEIFRKYAVLMNTTAAAVVLREGYEFAVRRNRDYPVQLGAVAVVASALLFTLYYTPQIIAAQALGPEATRTAAFQATHQASVVDFKILLAGLVLMLAGLLRHLPMESRR